MICQLKRNSTLRPSSVAPSTRALCFGAIEMKEPSVVVFYSIPSVDDCCLFLFALLLCRIRLDKCVIVQIM